MLAFREPLPVGLLAELEIATDEHVAVPNDGRVTDLGRGRLRPIGLRHLIGESDTMGADEGTPWAFDHGTNDRR